MNANSWARAAQMMCKIGYGATTTANCVWICDARKVSTMPSRSTSNICASDDKVDRRMRFTQMWYDIIRIRRAERLRAPNLINFCLLRNETTDEQRDANDYDYSAHFSPSTLSHRSIASHSNIVFPRIITLLNFRKLKIPFRCKFTDVRLSVRDYYKNNSIWKSICCIVCLTCLWRWRCDCSMSMRNETVMEVLI